MILAPLRGVTIGAFRRVFAHVIRESGFDEAFTPFISANPGLDPLKDRELASESPLAPLRLTPQFIGKDPAALRHCLRRVKSAGFLTADLNCGCPFPMVRNKGRGSGILRTPDVFERMIAAGCEELGDGKFSIKVRLGVDRDDELESLMPIVNRFPLRFITIHARNARQMYEGTCNLAALERVKALSKVPVIDNGDIDWTEHRGMVGRSFIRYLGTRDDISSLLMSYIDASSAELHGDHPVLGRMKELLAYWKDLPNWRRRWNVVKICRSVDELKTII